MSPPLSQPLLLSPSSVVVAKRGVVTKGGIVAEHGIVAKHGIIAKLGVVAKRCGVVVIVAAIDDGVTTKRRFVGVGSADPLFASNLVTPLGLEGLRDELGVVAERRGVNAERAVVIKNHGVVTKLGVVAKQHGVVAKHGVVITKHAPSGMASLPRLTFLPEHGVVVAKRALSGVALLPSGMASSTERDVAIIIAAIDGGVTTKQCFMGAGSTTRGDLC